MVRREKVNYAIQSVSHALDVLEQFSGETDEVGVTELSKRLKLHKNNVFRLLATLEARGYIEQNKATENYRLGVKCLRLGQTYGNQMGFLQQAKTTLRELARSTGESSYVAVKKGSSLIPLDFVEPQNPVRVISLLGQALPLHSTAAGKVHLAFESSDDPTRNLPDTLERYTDKTIVDREALLRHLKDVGEHGYAVDQGEFMAEVSSVAVPIHDYTRNLVGSLAIAGPSHRLNLQRIEQEIVPLITDGGHQLSSRLGYQR